MMHPVDITPIEVDHVVIDEAGPAAPGGTSGWWAVIAFVVVIALLVTAVIAFSGGDDRNAPVAPQPTEAPLDPGA